MFACFAIAMILAVNEPILYDDEVESVDEMVFYEEDFGEVALTDEIEFEDVVYFEEDSESEELITEEE